MRLRLVLLFILIPALALPYTVVRKDGKRFKGELVQQTDKEVILKDKDGVTITFRSDQIDWDQTTSQGKWIGEPASFDFKDIDIRDLFRFIADLSGYNVIVDPVVKGTVTLKLNNIPWDQALDVVTRDQGLGYTIEGNVIRIAPLSRIASEARERSAAQREKDLSSPLITKVVPLSYSRAVDMERIVKKLLTERGSCVSDPRTNILIITDVQSNVDSIIRLVSGPR